MTVAVLPFHVFSGRDDDRRLADRLADGVTAELARIARSVWPRTPARASIATRNARCARWTGTGREGRDGGHGHVDAPRFASKSGSWTPRWDASCGSRNSSAGPTLSTSSNAGRTGSGQIPARALSAMTVRCRPKSAKFGLTKTRPCTFPSNPRSHAQPQTRPPHAVQDAVRHRGRRRLAGARDRGDRGHLLAVQPDAAAAAAGAEPRRSW